MKKINLGILGGGQLGSMLCMAAKKLNIYTIVWSDDPMSPAKEFSNEFRRIENRIRIEDSMRG